jgi:malonyl-CoA O-methyltransferase
LWGEGQEPEVPALPRQTCHLDLKMNHKQAIQRNFGRRGASYDRYARVQQRMALELVRGCREALVRAHSILEVGCGTGYLTKLLRQANPTGTIVALDLDASLLKLARARLVENPGIHFIAADGEAFSGGSYDLIISNSVFQWFSRPRQTLQAYYRLLHPGGSLAFSTLGPATFRELGTAFRQAAGSLPLAESPEVVALSFSDVEKWQGFLGQAGYQEVVVQREECTETHPSVQDFLHALQATGATNPEPRPLSPRLFRHMAANYHRAFGVNGSIPVTYEVIWVFARKLDFSSD